MTTPPEDFQNEIDAFGQDLARVTEQVRRVIVGHRDVIDQVLTCLLAGGHALLEGVPGLGKTLLVRTLADTLDLSFRRIQFTPDLMPADIIGTHLVTTDPAGTGEKAFRFQKGPIFAHLILADEINRATPKTQSAVLEAMQERTVSVANTTYPLEEPFFVLATQNPLEMEGTYPLPEAQVDRFLLKIHLASPPADELMTILDRTTGPETPAAEKAIDAARIGAMRRTVRAVAAAEAVKNYVARIVRATHPDDPTAPPIVRRAVRYGSSPRGARAMLLAAKVAALRAGRANVSYADVRAAAAAALRHRLILSFEGQADGIVPDTLIAEVLEAVRQQPS